MAQQADLAAVFPHLSESERQQIATPQQRAQFAVYSGPYKLTPMYTADPMGALPFEGRGLMTQKMDGMFMLWDGVDQMYNRGRGGSGSGAQAHAQHPPASFFKHLPPVELEGELCFSSGEYSRGHGAKVNGWKDACLWVFDAPLHPGTYAERLEYVAELLKGYDSRYVRPVPHLGIATSRRVLDATLARVRATRVPRMFGSAGMVGASYEGGEGVMVRDPDAPYVHSCFAPKVVGHKKGQTTALYKWLEEYGNDECRVLRAPAAPAPAPAPQQAEAQAGVAPAEAGSARAAPASEKRRRTSSTPPAEQCKRQRGVAPRAGEELDGANSLLCELPNGTRFALRAISRLGQRASDVAVGSIITFTYHGWNAGVPLNASAQALRDDRSWQDIVDNFIPPPNLALGLVAGRVRRQLSLQRADSSYA